MKLYYVLSTFILYVYFYPLNGGIVEKDRLMCSSKHTRSYEIYCGGPIVATVNLHMIYNDSKVFVDKPLKYSPEVTLMAYNNLFGHLQPKNINPLDLKAFINEHFLPVGTDITVCVPDDWKPFPKKIMSIKDPILRKWALSINAIWKKLCKQVHPKVFEHPERYSIIPLKYKFIAPGGRFREIFYWDSYWIIKGLFASEMYETSAQMILNLANFIEQYGFIPNAGRVYFLERSHPPLFISMIYEYYKATKNVTFVERMLPLMEKEFQFWQNNRSLKLAVGEKEYTVYKYSANSNIPRPESYKEDITVNVLSTTSTKTQEQKLYRDIAAAAESGWDFSTRWFADNRTLLTIETTNILPIDLNSYLCMNLNILSYFYESVSKNKSKAEYYRNLHTEHKQMLQNVFFNKQHKVWLDYNLRTKNYSTKYNAALITPLFTNCYDVNDIKKSEDVLEFFNRSNAFDFVGGVPATMSKYAQEQWDYPNGWGNLNHMIVEGFRNSKSKKAHAAAYNIAKKWIRGNYKVFKATGSMWEKYDITGSYPSPGVGGEYEVQDGFGLTNGAILDLLMTYKNDMTLLN
uniref:Trehalase n=1 Tax=Panagrolaimus sp. PS1159 TaxID=55785 RepID=A0AC35G7Z0_9BILA